MPSKIERSTSLPSTPRATAVSRATQAAEVTPNPAVTAAKTSYAGQAAPTKELIPGGAQVSKSADPNSLWGEGPKRYELDPEAFARLPVAEQRATIKALRAERAELSVEIQERIAVLEEKWKHTRLSTRTEALREYEENGTRMSRGGRRNLGKLLDRSEAAQRRINELRARADALPNTPEAKQEMAAIRSELARELRKARDEQSKVVKEATELVDAEGLKVDRLVVTEQIIDPSAPKPGSGDSLFDKVKRFLSLDWFFDKVASIIVNIGMDERSFAETQRAERLAADQKVRDDRIERSRQQEQVQATTADQARRTREQQDAEALEKTRALVQVFTREATAAS